MNGLIDLSLLAVMVGLASATGMAADDLRVGSPFPSLVLPSLEDGRPLAVADFRGRKTVLHIWASW